MQQTLRQLIETEKASAEIDRLDAELAKFPVEHELIASELREAEEEVNQAKSALEHEELEERRLESQMRDQEELILKLTHQSAQVSSNQAYTALQNELEAAEMAKTEFETQALEHMEAIDAAKTVVGLAEEKLAEFVTAAPGRGEEIDSRRKVAEGERVAAVAWRAKECDGVDPKIMKRFDAVRAKKQPAVAILSTTSCPECKLVLPRIRYSEINRLEEIFECSNCKRLLAPEKAVASAG